jgi:hypothetical protein
MSKSLTHLCKITTCITSTSTSTSSIRTNINTHTRTRSRLFMVTTHHLTRRETLPL